MIGNIINFVIENKATIIPIVLGVVTLLDHILAGNKNVKSNSTGQLIINTVKLLLPQNIDDTPKS